MDYEEYEGIKCFDFDSNKICPCVRIDSYEDDLTKKVIGFIVMYDDGAEYLIFAHNLEDLRNIINCSKIPQELHYIVRAYHDDSRYSYGFTHGIPAVKYAKTKSDKCSESIDFVMEANDFYGQIYRVLKS